MLPCLSGGFTGLGVDFASFGPLDPEPDQCVRSVPAALPQYEGSDVDPAVVMSFETDFRLDAPAPRRPRTRVC